MTVLIFSTRSTLNIVNMSTLGQDFEFKFKFEYFETRLQQNTIFLNNDPNTK
jgi:hypothetical protein